MVPFGGAGGQEARSLPRPPVPRYWAGKGKILAGGEAAGRTWASGGASRAEGPCIEGLFLPCEGDSE